MKITVPGHSYDLENFEVSNEKDQPEMPAGSKSYQVIHFINKEPVLAVFEEGKDPEPTGELKTIKNGTTNEEVLKVLIDRMQFLQSKFPCRENAITITKLEEALMWQNKRTEDRKNRGVEGKHKK